MEQHQIVVLYDAENNESCMLEHNWTAHAAEQLANANTDRGTAIILPQSLRHKEPNPAAGRTCRLLVRQKANLQPPPKFVRRISRQQKPIAAKHGSRSVHSKC